VVVDVFGPVGAFLFEDCFTTRKNDFSGGSFLYYLGLKPLLNYLPRVSNSLAKPSLRMC